MSESLSKQAACAHHIIDYVRLAQESQGIEVAWTDRWQCRVCHVPFAPRPGKQSMSPTQEQTLTYILSTSHELLDQKFRAGDREHRSESTGIMDLSVNTLLHCAIEEALDQLVYLLTIKRKLDQSKSVEGCLPK